MSTSDTCLKFSKLQIVNLINLLYPYIELLRLTSIVITLAIIANYIANIFAGACAETSAESNTEWKNSVKEAARNLVTAIKSAPMPPPPPDGVTQNILLAWMQPVS